MCSCPSDEMEFEVTSDQRTGKPIACRVVRLEAGSVSFEVCSSSQLNIVSVSSVVIMSGSYLGCCGFKSCQSGAQILSLPYTCHVSLLEKCHLHVPRVKLLTNLRKSTCIYMPPKT